MQCQETNNKTSDHCDTYVSPQTIKNNEINRICLMQRYANFCWSSL